MVSYYVIINALIKKIESYYKWSKAYHMVLNNKHITPKGLSEIKALSRQVNIITSNTGSIGHKN